MFAKCSPIPVHGIPVYTCDLYNLRHPSNGKQFQDLTNLASEIFKRVACVFFIGIPSFEDNKWLSQTTPTDIIDGGHWRNYGPEERTRHN